uniref:LicD family protein n=1 Tax=uncultured Duncaniella sp. TaxID=2768039 RepID=UPI0027346B1B
MINLSEEIRNGYTVSTLSKRVWQIQLDMLGVLLKVCKKYNLKIWAEGGTLIGAIRHKGFIPWDDDIDISISRPDYEKL